MATDRKSPARGGGYLCSRNTVISNSDTATGLFGNDLPHMVKNLAAERCRPRVRQRYLYLGSCRKTLHEIGLGHLCSPATDAFVSTMI